MFSFERGEVMDLIISAIVLAFLFGYPFANCGGLTCVGVNLVFMILIVSTAFIGHEMAHKFVAQQFGCPAGYKMWKQGLIGATLLKLIWPAGPVFAAPGAVMFYPYSRTHGRISTNHEGLIALAGPLSNVLIGLFFLFIMPNPIGISGAYVNFALALFNLWPIPPLDGSIVFKWNIVYWGLAALGIFLLQWGLG